MGIECFRVEFPKGMDANEYALKVTPAAKSLGVLDQPRGVAGQERPTRAASRSRPSRSIEPLPAETKAAAKEKMIEATPEPAPAATDRPPRSKNRFFL